MGKGKAYTRNFGYPCSEGRGLIEKETGKVAKQVRAPNRSVTYAWMLDSLSRLRFQPSLLRMCVLAHTHTWCTRVNDREEKSSRTVLFKR